MKTINLELEMEQAVIAGLLSEPGAVFDVAGRLRPEMFANLDLRFVYTALLSLNAKGVAVDMLTVEDEMQRLDATAFGRLGGLSFLSPMLLSLRNNSHIRVHVAEVVRRYAIRHLLLGVQELGMAAQRPEADVLALVGGLDDLALELRRDLTPSTSIEEAGAVAVRVLSDSYGKQQRREAGEATHVRTGFSELDDLTGGLYPGELTVVPGRPSMGKTAVALWMALTAARKGNRVVIFSIEMSKEQLVGRLLSMISGVEGDKLRFKGTDAADRAKLSRANEELSGLPLVVEYCGSDTVDDIRAKALLMHRQGKLDLCFIDYLNLINIVVPKGSLQDTTDLAMGAVARKIKLMAEEMQVPVALLAQMNRESEKRPAPHFPVLSDLRNSGAIEQIADVVVFVYRAEKYNIFYDKDTHEDLRGVGMLLVAKNRNGATGVARFRYNPSMTRMTDYNPTLF
ncbi:MAG: DnaB-like helicase C-terminal domain-containing protein [Tannerellaceae bacterium]